MTVKLNFHFLLKLCLLCVSASWVACSSITWTEKNTTALQPSQEILLPQDQLLTQAEAALTAAQFQNAEAQFRKFEKNYPQSVLLQRSNLGLARAVAGQGRWVEAAQVYRRVIETTRSTQPEIAVQAMLKLSYCYEAIGDQDRLLASLKDVEAWNRHLPSEQRMTEFPARMAAALNKSGQSKEAKKFYQSAERGAATLVALSTMHGSEQKAAELFYHMGVLPNEDLTPETVKGFMDSLAVHQNFLLRSIEIQAEGWSNLAAQNLVRNYQLVWGKIQDWPENKALDPSAAKQIRAEFQNQLTGEMLKLLTQLKLYQIPEKQERMTILTEVTNQLDDIQQSAQSFLMYSQDSALQTPESQKRTGLKKEGIRLINPEPPQAKDPNLGHY